MDEVGNDEADGVGLAAGEAAGQHVGLIVQLLHALEHALACFFTDICVAPQHLGDGDDGDPEIARNVFQPDCHITRSSYSLPRSRKSKSVPIRRG